MSQVESIKIRMYNTGSVGDCLLLLFCKGDQVSFSMLIDCGGFNTSAQLINPCVEDIKKTCGGKLDLLAVTHQHEDHVSGFNLARDLFNEIEVKQVWMSWVEDKGDAVAKILKAKYGKKLKQLRKTTEAGIQAMKSPSVPETALRGAGRSAAVKLQNMQQALALLEFEEGAGHGNKLAAGSKTTGDAMEYVRKKSTVIDYKIPGEVVNDMPGAEGIKFYILGPPREKELTFLKIDTKEEEMYKLAATAAAAGQDTVSQRLFESGINLEEGVSPFGEEYHLAGDEQKAFFRKYHSPAYKWRQIETDWLESSLGIALAMTRLTNNTSLAIALEFAGTGAVMLLPADAQSGNWMSWHKPEVSDNLKKNGGKSTDELLANTVFYKVGHHGSHNGTASLSGLDLVKSRKLVAFMPLVQDKVPVQWGGAANFPARALYKKLIEKTKGRIIRTDEGIITDAGAKKLRDALPAAEGKEFKQSFRKGPCYFEYTVTA